MMKNEMEFLMVGLVLIALGALILVVAYPHLGEWLARARELEQVLGPWIPVTGR